MARIKEFLSIVGDEVLSIRVEDLFFLGFLIQAHVIF